MADNPPPKFDPAQMTKARDEFHQIYGATLAMWSSLEDALFYWFMHMTHMPEELARTVFYSAKSFNARADMIEAATVKAAIDRPTSEFITAVLKKARGYSGFRNSATHGTPMYTNSADNNNWEYVLVQGKHDIYEAGKTKITIRDLEIARKNFNDLRGLAADVCPLTASWGDPAAGPPVLPETHRALVLALPREANSTEPAPTRTRG